MFNITRIFLSLLFFCQLLRITRSQLSKETQQNHTTVVPINTSTTIQLLVLLPGLSAYQNHSDVASWDRGAEIMPGADIAVEAINKDPSILCGYQLELIKVDIDRCIQDQAYSNINAFLAFSPFNRSHEPNTLGVIGLFCPELVRLVSPIAGRPNETDLFQLSGSVSPHLHNTRYRYLSFIVPSSAAYYETAFKFIEQFEWRQLFIISESFFDVDSIFESRKVTDDFEITFREFTQPYSAVIRELRLSEKNIVFSALNAEKTARMLCLAYQAGLTGSEYVWIIQDHDEKDLLFYVSETCPLDDLLKAIEGVFLFRYQYKPSEDDLEPLVSGNTYNKFYAEYLRRLGDLDTNLFANVLHDSVWAFAIALNETLEYINTSISVVDYVQHFGKGKITNIMRSRLEQITFRGASGVIQFNNRSDVEATVDIFQLGVNGTPTRIGLYDQHTQSIYLNLSTLLRPLPPDNLPYKHNLIPTPLVVTFSIICGLCIIFTTAVFILFFYYRRSSKEIKATSPNLSILMFVGCYILFGATFVHSISAAFAITVRAIGITLCGTVIAGDTIGVNLIFVTLLLRMLRVYRIFSYFGKTGKLWSDKVLLGIVVLIIGGDILLIVVWMCVDTFKIEDKITYQPDATPPYYEVIQFCSSQSMDVWLSLVMVKVGILFLIVLFLAIKTRKIRKENFKDTKKVNIYIFITVMIISTAIPLWFLLKNTGSSIGVYVAVYLSFGLTGVLCLAFLFVPKIAPPFLRTFGWYIEFDEELQTRTLTRKQPRASITTLYAQRPLVTSFVSATINNNLYLPTVNNSTRVVKFNQ